jgi:hypothetical protein
VKTLVENWRLTKVGFVADLASKRMIFYKDYLYLCSSVRAFESSTPSAFRSLFFDTGQKQIPYTCTNAQIKSEISAKQLRLRHMSPDIITLLWLKQNLYK